MRNNSYDVIIVGAGLAGLTAARYLQTAGLDALVLESSDRPGGRVKSDHIEGFILDHGFQVINPRYPEVIASRFLDKCDFRSFPAGFRVVDGTRSSQLTLSRAFSSPGSLKEKLAFLDFLRAPASNTLSLGSASEKFPVLFREVLEPFLRGVFLAHPSEVSREAAQKIMRSFIVGRPGLPTGGVGEFSEFLAESIDAIRYNCIVQEVKGNRVLTNDEELNAEFIIVASDPTTAHQLINGREIPHVCSSATWYHVAQNIPSDSNLLAAQKSGVVVNSLVLSELMPSYAPSDKHLISTTTILPVSESDVRRELSQMWKTSTHDWELLAKYDIKQSLPFFGVGKAINGEQHVEGGIYLAGDHCAYPSQQGAMESGRIAAQEIIRRALPTR